MQYPQNNLVGILASNAPLLWAVKAKELEHLYKKFRLKYLPFYINK